MMIGSPSAYLKDGLAPTTMRSTVTVIEIPAEPEALQPPPQVSHTTTVKVQKCQKHLS